MKRAVRTQPELRKDHILKAAINVSIKKGYRSITQRLVANEAKVSCALVSHYYPVINDLKNEILETAIDKEILEIIAQGIILKDERVKRMSDKTFNKVINYLKTKN